MTRRRYKFLQYVVVLVPLVLVFFSPFSESLRWWLLSRYEIRWHVENETTKRTQIVSVHNNGSATLSKARINLEITSSNLRPVSDISFARLETGPQISLFDSIASSESASAPARFDFARITQVLDRHSKSRSLFALDQAFDGVLLPTLQTNKQFTRVLNDLTTSNQGYNNWHRIWLQKCKELKVPDNACQEGDTELRAWEASKRSLIETGHKKWYEATGVDVRADNDQLSPSGKVGFTFDLGAHESGLLRIDYNPDPAISASTNVQVLASSIADASRVMDKDDLSAPFVIFMFKYHPLLFTLVLVILIAMLSFSWPILRPKQLVPIHKVFRTALITDDHEYWEHAYARHRFYILQEFRDMWHDLGLTGVAPGSEEIFDYVRNRLIKEFRPKPGRLKNERRLNAFIRTSLEELLLPLVPTPA